MTAKKDPLASLELTPKEIATIMATVFYFAKYPEVIKEDIETASEVLAGALRAAAGIDR